MNPNNGTCTTLFFESVEMFERAKRLARQRGIRYCSIPFAWADPSIETWAICVETEQSARIKDILTADRVPILGQYVLPGAERPLPQRVSPGSSDGEGKDIIIKRMWLTFVDQCFADVNKIRLIANHSKDIAPLLPFLNSAVKAAQYNPEVPVLTYKEGVRMISVYRDKIGIAKADDLLDAWLCLKEVKDKIEWVHDHQDDILPNFDVYTPPTALDIYKLLPRTNCRECGKPTCMAFAAAVANGETELDRCPILMKTEWLEEKNELLELLGEAP